MADPFGLERYVLAQAPVIGEVRQELRAGRKRTHWMWFIFPQLRALGRSPTAQRFGITSLAEAQAYAAHPILGPRLSECAGLVLAIAGRSAHEIFGTPDDMKLRSSMTLFAVARPDDAVFTQVLQRYYNDVPDPLTRDLLTTG